MDELQPGAAGKFCTMHVSSQQHSRQHRCSGSCRCRAALDVKMRYIAARSVRQQHGMLIIPFCAAMAHKVGEGPSFPFYPAACDIADGCLLATLLRHSHQIGDGGPLCWCSALKVQIKGMLEDVILIMLPIYMHCRRLHCVHARNRQTVHEGCCMLASVHASTPQCSMLSPVPADAELAQVGRGSSQQLLVLLLKPIFP